MVLVNELVIAEPKFIIQTNVINGVQEFQSLNCETALEISIQISIISQDFDFWNIIIIITRAWRPMTTPKKSLD